MTEVEVIVAMNPIELKLFRRAIAKAVDDGLLDTIRAKRRIDELDALRWEAEEKEAGSRFQGSGFGKKPPMRPADLRPQTAGAERL